MKRVLFWGLIVLTTALPFLLDRIDIGGGGSNDYFIYSLLLIPLALLVNAFPSWKSIVFNILFFQALEIFYKFYIDDDRMPINVILVVHVSINILILSIIGYLRLRIGKLLSSLEEMAIADPLTGAYNRRYFERYMEKAIPHLRSSKNSFLLIALDVDHFKAINDSLGHSCGDFVLKELTNVIKNNLRQTDEFFRFGGEEFMIIIPRTNLNVGVSIGERVRKAIEQTNFVYKGNKLHVTISLGLASFSDEPIQEFIEKADKALYYAKENGRNQLIVSYISHVSDIQKTV